MPIRICSIFHKNYSCGPGPRAAVFLKDQGDTVSTEEFIELVTSNPEDIGVSFRGCDPIHQYEDLIPILEILKERNIQVFVYTHCSPEELELMIYQKVFFSRFLKLVDLFICNPYEIEHEDEHSLYRASTNQQLIMAVEHEDDPAIIVLHDVTNHYHPTYAA